MQRPDLRSCIRSGLIAPMMALVLAAGANPVRAQETEAAVLNTFQTAPGTGGGTFANLSVPSMNASGDVAFRATVSGGSLSDGVFVHADHADRAVALKGETAPDTGGGTYFSFFVASPSINSQGDVAFRATITGGTGAFGIFLADSAGSHTAIAVAGNVAPGTGGGTYLNANLPSLNADGDVAFRASISGGTTTEGIFAVDSVGTETAVAVTGDTAPGTGGGTYAFDPFGIPAINASGDVALRADVVGGTAAAGIFVVDSSGSSVAVALEGQTAPDTGGGTYSFSNLDFPAINASGEVAFVALVTGGSTSAGLFVVDSVGSSRAVALVGQSAPGAGGGTYSAFGTRPAINDSGDVAFQADLSGGIASSGVFALDSAGLGGPSALSGRDAAGTNGEYLAFASPVTNTQGDVAFFATLTGATSATEGIFVVDPDFTTPFGDNAYRFVPGNFSWDEARANALQLSYNGAIGHLVTVTSQAEHDFLAQHFLVGGLPAPNAWIGGQRVNGFMFEWITGEGDIGFCCGFFTAWRVGEPDNVGGVEDVMAYFNPQGWMDLERTRTDVAGYLVEFESATTFRFKGHYYRLVLGSMTWGEANAAAQLLTHRGEPGHLATITSQAEYDFVTANLPEATGPLLGAWIGGFESATEGTYTWVNGEGTVGTNGFTGWGPGQPSNDGGSENRIHFSTDGWDDAEGTRTDMIGYLVEFPSPNLPALPIGGLAALATLFAGTAMHRLRRSRNA